MPHPMPTTRSLFVAALAACIALPALAETSSETALQALRSVSRRYGHLVREIDPDYLPGDMAGYAEATETLEKLGTRLETLSRLAIDLETNGGDWEQVREGSALLDADITALKALSAPLRAYSYAIRSQIKRPRWAISQVKPAEFIAPPARAFAGSFTNTVKVQGQAGQEVYFQLVAVPILKPIDDVEIKLPRKLKGPAGDVGEFSLECFFAITRSAPLEEADRQFPLCPYRLRPSSERADIDGDQVLPCWFRLLIPEAAQPGAYTGSMEFQGYKVPDMPLKLELTVVGQQ